METTTNPTVHFLGIEFDLTILVMSLLTVLIAFGIIFWTSRKMAIKPKGKQTFIEYIYEFVQNTIKPNLGEYTKNYSLLMFTFFFFILVANNLGLLIKLESEEHNFWTSPTSNFMVDFTLSLIIAVVVHFEGIRKNGIVEYLKSYLTPYPAMLPMNILEQFTNLISLALRLYGNIYAGEIVMSLIVSVGHSGLVGGPAGFVLNMAWTAFSAFIGCIQAYVFTILSSKYIGEKVCEEEE
ncbi:F0F1 ATP synthase subunit A [Streptococcus saliviloxodontae]|uniref:ATP synthase subunit a n=1 Tax=Streptococcus saliviloxodontae TaxID=1349416 RepID=A0ABS2PLA3_9STRE|nr:F0F1 ATP synthase subunit A [Streptococcus saliviloxodontae]MBM7636146.1 F-type H+-transporting ATPase subunit a [Streptococcus saliviloxodontae]